MHRFRVTVRAAAAVTALIAFAACTPIDSPGPRVTESVKRANDVSASSDPVIVAAGDIVCGNNTPTGTACVHAQTASLIGTINPDAVLLLGDNQYEDGTLAEYNALYGPTWGQYKAITYPSVGNHEYQTANASGYFDYFNGVGVQTGRAGDRSKGYYSYDLGTWHLIAINSNCGSVGGCGVGSAQEVWLKADLAAHPNACTLAYWHHPRFSSGQHSDDPSTQALWDALYKAKADLILTGHDHNYERFAPMTSTGVLDNANGIRSFVVGTGGKEQRSMGATKANSIVRSNNSFGVLKVTLHPTSYDWQFMPIAGSTLNDAGSSTCVGVTAANQPPIVTITAPVSGSTVVKGSPVTFTGGAIDPEDGVVPAASLIWTIQAGSGSVIGSGNSFTTSALPLGTYTYTLIAKDLQRQSGHVQGTITVVSAAPPNQSPVASITSPANGTSVLQGASVSFAGTGIDPEDGALSGASLVWTSSIDGTIGTGVSFTKNNLATGTHTITLTVTDSKGATNATSRSITIAQTPPTNQPPIVTITAPSSGSTIAFGTLVAFAGSAVDPEDGVVPAANLRWTIQAGSGAVIGSGNSFTTRTLPRGTYTYTLIAKDSRGLSGHVQGTITVF